MKRNVAIFIFDDVEVLDFSGPFEVFSVASALNDHQLYNVFTVARKKKPVIAVNGLSVNPDYDFQTTPHIDVLIIAGGTGTKKIITDEISLAWIGEVHEKSEYTMSICSGARILGVLGILDHFEFVTHHQVYDHMGEIAPKAIPIKDKRYLHNGKTYTSAGISAGIDLSFHMVGKLSGNAVMQSTAEYMEYNLEMN